MGQLDIKQYPRKEMKNLETFDHEKALESWTAICQNLKTDAPPKWLMRKILAIIEGKKEICVFAAELTAKEIPIVDLWKALFALGRVDFPEFQRETVDQAILKIPDFVIAWMSVEYYVPWFGGKSSNIAFFTKVNELLEKEKNFVIALLDVNNLRKAARKTSNRLEVNPYIVLNGNPLRIKFKKKGKTFDTVKWNLRAGDVLSVIDSEITKELKTLISKTNTRSDEVLILFRSQTSDAWKMVEKLGEEIANRTKFTISASFLNITPAANDQTLRADYILDTLADLMEIAKSQKSKQNPSPITFGEYPPK